MQRKWKNATAYIIAIWYFPNFLGGILVRLSTSAAPGDKSVLNWWVLASQEITLPWSDKPGLLGALFLCNTFGVAYANSLLW